VDPGCDGLRVGAGGLVTERVRRGGVQGERRPTGPWRPPEFVGGLLVQADDVDLSAQASAMASMTPGRWVCIRVGRVQDASAGLL